MMYIHTMLCSLRSPTRSFGFTAISDRQLHSGLNLFIALSGFYCFCSTPRKLSIFVQIFICYW